MRMIIRIALLCVLAMPGVAWATCQQPYSLSNDGVEAEGVATYANCPPPIAEPPPPPATHDAEYVGVVVPATMVAGQTYAVSVLMKNTGTQAWSSGTGVRLGAQNPIDNTRWNIHRVSLAGTVAPGQVATIGFTVRAPVTAGTHSFQWRMVQEGVAWFGAASHNMSVVVHTGAVSALPNPCIIATGATTCTATVTWSSSASNTEVWVSNLDGSNPARMTTAQSGTTAPPWISANQVAYARDERAGLASQYVYLGSRLVAIRETNLATGEAAVKYQHTDALGSPVAVTNASGELIERTEYEPYGSVVNRIANDGPGFTGHVFDSATGMLQMQQRYFDPTMPRFLSVDAITAYSSGDTRHFNPYAYGFNNPYRYTDPDGRAAHVLAGGIIGGLFSGGSEGYRQLQSGKLDAWSLIVETGKGVLVGSLTAAVPAAATLKFGGTAGKFSVSVANAAAAAGAGEIGAQAAKGEEIDASKAMSAAVSNSVGFSIGSSLSKVAKGLSTTSISGTPGVPVQSHRGVTFMVGKEPTRTFIDPIQQQAVQDVAGALTSTVINEVDWSR